MPTRIPARGDDGIGPRRITAAHEVLAANGHRVTFECRHHLASNAGRHLRLGQNKGWVCVAFQFDCVSAFSPGFARGFQLELNRFCAARPMCVKANYSFIIGMESQTVLFCVVVI